MIRRLAPVLAVLAAPTFADAQAAADPAALLSAVASMCPECSRVLHDLTPGFTARCGHTPTVEDYRRLSSRDPAYFGMLSIRRMVGPDDALTGEVRQRYDALAASPVCEG